MATVLSDLARQGGWTKWCEGDEPYDQSVIDELIHFDLVECYMSGGMASTDVVLELTERGRRQVGLPPVWWKRALQWAFTGIGRTA